MKVPEGWREMELGELFTESQCAELVNLIDAKDKAGLKSYLHSLSDQLQAKGVLPDYLYYYLEYLVSLPFKYDKQTHVFLRRPRGLSRLETGPGILTMWEKDDQRRKTEVAGKLYWYIAGTKS